jgi:hypothetical protein
MNRKGTIRHVWDIGPRSTWEDVEQIWGFSRASNICAVGAHLFDYGDLLVSYQGRNTYLYGAGT